MKTRVPASGWSRVASSVALIAGVALAIVPTMAAAVFIVTAPWVRPAGEGRTTEAYMELRSTEGATLVGVRCELAAEAVLYAAGKGSLGIERLSLPAGGAVKLAPGANRVGLVRLTRALKLGDRVPLTLTIEAGDGRLQEIPVDAEVRQRSVIDDHLRGHRH